MNLAFIGDFYISDTLRRAPDLDRFPALQAQVERNWVWITDLSAAAMFDYCALICLGEARHSKIRLGVYYPALTTHGYDRSSVFQHALHFAPADFLPKMSDLFHHYNWGGSYGGDKWGDVADFSLDYLTGHVPPAVFTDHVLDLEHNGGKIFNKPECHVVIDFQLVWPAGGYSNFLEALDYKFSHDLLNDVQATAEMFSYLSLPVGRTWLGYLAATGRDRPNHTSYQLNYQPAVWGNDSIGPLSGQIKSNDTVKTHDQEAEDEDEKENDQPITTPDELKSKWGWHLQQYRSFIEQVGLPLRQCDRLYATQD